MLRITNYKKSYGSFEVLSISNLQLSQNIYWLQGDNGSGKTTLLKSIAGLIPFDGEIEVNTINLKKQRREYTKQVNWAEAEPLYPSFLTGKDLVDFYFRTKGGNKENVQQLIKAFGIDKFINNKNGSYSTGMIKKLSLVLAFIGKPKLILLDEPFITLDSEALQTLHQLIERTSANEVSFFISSHQPLQLKHSYSTLQVQNKLIKVL